MVSCSFDAQTLLGAEHWSSFQVVHTMHMFLMDMAIAIVVNNSFEIRIVCLDAGFEEKCRGEQLSLVTMSDLVPPPLHFPQLLQQLVPLGNSYYIQIFGGSFQYLKDKKKDLEFLHHP